MKSMDYSRPQSRRQRHPAVSLTAALLLQVVCARVSLAVVLDFDDLNYSDILSGGSGYAGLIWEQGTAGLLGYPGVWAVPSQGFEYPHSAPHNIFNGNGSTSIGISFPTPVDVSGAYIAVQGNGQTAWTQNLVVHGYRAGQPVVSTAPFTTISTTPAWFDMSVLTNVDRIVFDASPSVLNQSYFGLDDLTFTYVPEPAGISLGLLALGGLLLRRRR